MSTRQDKDNETEDEGWDFEMRQTLWTMFIESKGWNAISQAVGKSVKACECEVWKINTQYYREDKNSLASKEHGRIMGPDRRGKRWKRRETKALQVARKGNDRGCGPVPLARIATLLGRSLDEIKKQVQPRHGRATFFPRSET